MKGVYDDFGSWCPVLPVDCDPRGLKCPSFDVDLRRLPSPDEFPIDSDDPDDYPF